MRRIAPETYRKWVLLGCGFATGGYSLTFLTAMATVGWDFAPLVRISELVTIGVGVLGLLLALKRHVDLAAFMVVGVLWAQAHVGMFVTGALFRPGSFVLPALVIAGGLLIGRSAGWVLGVSGALSTFAAAALPYLMEVPGVQLRAIPPWKNDQEIVFAVIISLVLIGIAAILHVALAALERSVAQARESAARFERLVADAPDGILSLDPSGRILSANPQAVSIFDRASSSLVGVDFASLFSGQDVTLLRDWIEGGAEGTVRLRTATRILEGTGRQLAARGGTGDTQIILRDVSDRETASELAAELSRVVRETPAEVVFFRADDGSVVLTSRGLRANLGFDGGELTDRHIWDLSPRLEQAGLRELVRRLESTPGDTIRVSGIHRRLDGSVYPVEAEYALGELSGKRVVIGFITDVTSQEAARREQLELQRQLEHAQKMEAVGHLAGGVAHDFNNLLTVVGGCAEILRQDVPPDLHELVDEISQAQERGQELIQRLLTFARREIAQPRVIRMEELVEAALVLLRRLVGEKVQVEHRVEGSPPPIRIDPGQAEQVLMNLAANARDAMPDGGALTIRLSESASGGLRVEVADTGVGIPADVVASIFEPFFTTKAVGAGTGLGLATVQSIVLQAGGTIDVESEPGAGTRFVMEWPAADASELDTQEPEAGPSEDGELEILYVEDLPETRNLVSRLLRRAGHTVHVAESAEAALALPMETIRSVDLVVTDVVMPGISGIAMAEELRDLGVHVPVLFVSGYLDEGLHGTVPEDGLHDLLLKPFSGKELNARIAALMGSAGGPSRSR